MSVVSSDRLVAGWPSCWYIPVLRTRSVSAGGSEGAEIPRGIFKLLK